MVLVSEMRDSPKTSTLEACVPRIENEAPMIKPLFQRSLLRAALLAVVVPAALLYLAQGGQSRSQTGSHPFEKREAMIPVRDGIKLHTVIFIPKDHREALPILMTRTPYGADTSAEAINQSQKELVEEGYIFVRQDI